MTTPRLAAALTLSLLLLAGCGDDEEPADQAEDSPSATRSAEVDGCEFLPLTVVTEAAGEEMEVVAAGPVTCIFSSLAEETPTAITLNVLRIQIDPEEYADGSRGYCQDEPTQVDAGDQAWTCVTFVGPQGYVFEGSLTAVLDVVAADDEDDAAALALAEAVLPSVTLH